ncbi:hypothetical protein WJX74_009587 [Apatococcus lobatus]|uniref:CENP-V/GFA domain-containing protein n=1 Tax=Apatococcus lobatus TaxID=904363 RepID=A0AAW1SBE6_9CHLO
MHCYCSICRKANGGGGYAINLGGEAESLRIEGRDRLKKYNAKIRKDGKEETSPGERNFCGDCGSALWLWDPRWPELIHPNASAVDTPLPTPPEIVQIFLESKPSWIQVPDFNEVKVVNFDAYPKESLEDWHKRHNLFDPPAPQ